MEGCYVDELCRSIVLRVTEQIQDVSRQLKTLFEFNCLSLGCVQLMQMLTLLDH